jgi:hypothetical protein
MFLESLKMLNPFPGRALVAAAAVSAGLLGMARPAHAALMLTLSEAGYAPVTLTDATNTGSLSYSGSYGDFSTNFVIGYTNQLTGAGPVANLQIESLDVTSLTNSGAKTLTVSLDDPGYTFPGTTGSTVTLGSSIGGTLTGASPGDAVTFQSFVSSPAVSTGLQTFVVQGSPGASTPFSSAATPVPFVRGSTFELSDVTTISLAGAGDTANVSGATTVTAPVPEPATASLLAVASAMFLRRRRRSI